MTKPICPLRMLAQKSINAGELYVAIQRGLTLDKVACLEADCAWWDSDFGQCAVAALAHVFTYPVARAEDAGGSHPFDSPNPR